MSVGIDVDEWRAATIPEVAADGRGEPNAIVDDSRLRNSGRFQPQLTIVLVCIAWRYIIRLLRSLLISSHSIEAVSYWSLKPDSMHLGWRWCLLYHIHMKCSRRRNTNAAINLVFSLSNGNEKRPRQWEAFEYHVWSKSDTDLYTAINKNQTTTNNLDVKLRVHARGGDEETTARNISSGDTVGVRPHLEMMAKRCRSRLALVLSKWTLDMPHSSTPRALRLIIFETKWSFFCKCK
jgi:hypothetical protein